jgi:hypothetical protein
MVKRSKYSRDLIGQLMHSHGSGVPLKIMAERYKLSHNQLTYVIYSLAQKDHTSRTDHIEDYTNGYSDGFSKDWHEHKIKKPKNIWQKIKSMLGLQS